MKSFSVSAKTELDYTYSRLFYSEIKKLMFLFCYKNRNIWKLEIFIGLAIMKYKP